MKSPALVLGILAMLLFVPASHAALQEWTIDISLSDDKTSDWVVSYSYDAPVQKSDFFILAGVTSFNVTADGQPVDCSISRSIGSSIVCNNINARSIVYSIRTFPVISSLQGLSIFTHRFSIIQLTGKFSINIKLPYGTALAEGSKLEGTGLNPFEPQGGRQGSDGRRIFVQWDYQNPKLGDTSDFAVVYEQVQPVDFNVFTVIIAAVIIAFLAFLVFFFRRSRVEDMLPVLTDNERRVMELVLRDKQIDQRKIVKETDFSKAKVSRIIQDLERRGLIEKRIRGRNNIISLKKTRNLADLGEKQK